MLKQELLNKTINATQDCVESEYLHIFFLDLLQIFFSFVLLILF